MPFVTSSKTKPAYDVIIVGSGAAGGQSAYVLTAAGARVLMLEAGRNYDPVSETPMFNPPLQAPLRGAGTPDKPFGFYDATVNGGWTVPKEPYMVKNHKRGNGWYEANDIDVWSTGQNFMWWRPRMLGGRTNHWARFSFRMGPYDFKPKSRDGLGMDWPITYEDMAPYYDKVEALIGVYGTNEGLENTPDSSPGVLLPPPKPRANELLAKKFCAKLGIPVIPAHVAILSQQQNADKIPARLHPDNPAAARVLADNMRTRLGCFWATPCSRGCSIKANYQSTTVHLPPALAGPGAFGLFDRHARELSEFPSRSPPSRPAAQETVAALTVGLVRQDHVPLGFSQVHVAARFIYRYRGRIDEAFAEARLIRARRAVDIDIPRVHVAHEHLARGTPHRDRTRLLQRNPDGRFGEARQKLVTARPKRLPGAQQETASRSARAERRP